MPSNMPTTITSEGICNMALGHLKITNQISILASDLSAEAVACRTFYDICKLEMMEDFKWPFATTQGPLSLIEDNPFEFDLGSADTSGDGPSVGDSEWSYAYQYPPNCVNFVRIISGTRNEARMDRVPFRIFNNNTNANSNQGGTKMILTDMECAFGEWTTSVTQEDSFSAAVVLALSYKLAAIIAPMVTGGDPFKLGDKAEANYTKQLMKAQGNALNEEQMEEDPESEFVLARGYRHWSWNQRNR